MYSDSIFLFSVHKSIQDKKEYELTVPFGDYQITYCNTTPMMRASFCDRELLIYGYAVDVRDGTYQMLAERILSNTSTVEDVISSETHLGGKYLLLYKDETGMYVIPDATASVPFCYSTGECELVCASNSEYVANKLSIQPDEKLLKIRRSSVASQAMPYNLTVYREIEQLLPNHYFSFYERKALRFVNHKQKRSPKSAEEAARITTPLIENLLKYYSEKFTLYCPITSGRDSRVVLSYMLPLNKNTETYTIKHNNFRDDEPDVRIPSQIAQAVNIVNNQIFDAEPAQQMYAEFDAEFGKTGYSRRTLMIANTIKMHYSNGAVINGDIIGQVGKCSLHRDIPVAFATARYFRCKLHNYSKESVTIIKKWIRDIENSGEQVNLFDLFSMESRMGRWAAQENLIYAMVGQPYLNIFNSRSIVYPWTLVPRKQRKLSKIHMEMIRQKYPALLDVPFGGNNSKLESITKWNGLSYYIASFIKYYVEKCSFLHKQRRRENL